MKNNLFKKILLIAPFPEQCREEKNQNSLENNVRKYSVIDGNIIILNPGVKTIIPYPGGGYDGPDY